MMNLNPYVLSNPVSLVSCLETLVWIPFGINDKINFWSNGDTSYNLGRLLRLFFIMCCSILVLIAGLTPKYKGVRKLYEEDLIVFSPHALERLTERFTGQTDSPFGDLFK